MIIINNFFSFRIHDQTPVLLLNLWTFSNYFVKSITDFKVRMFGFRLNQVQADFESFLIKLRDNGAQIVFVFKKYQRKEMDFIQNTEFGYKYGCGILDVIAQIKTTNAVVQHFEKHKSTKQYIDICKLFPMKSYLALVLTQTAQKYGKLYGMDNLDCKPTTVHAQLANKYNAMAIIGGDSYYVFYGGKWKFWSDTTLDMETMTIREYDKAKILENLQITVQQAPLFVALAGGLYSSSKNLADVSNYFKSRDRELSIFEKIPNFINLQHFPITDENLNLMLQQILGRKDESIFLDFRKTLELMNPEIELKYECNDRKIWEVSENGFMNYANEILSNGIIPISPVFTDLR